ncbi:MAG: hypothetical protein ACRCX2_14370 [Paraclostridium sp.]
MIKMFRGIAKENWQEQCKQEDYVTPFREARYFIDMINGTIEIINPDLVIDNRNWDDRVCLPDRDNNYLRFVLDENNVIDIPKENIIYVHTKHGDFINREEYLKTIESEEDAQILKTIEEREKNDTGARHSIEDLEELV